MYFNSDIMYTLYCVSTYLSAGDEDEESVELSKSVTYILEVNTDVFSDIFSYHLSFNLDLILFYCK